MGKSFILGRLYLISDRFQMEFCSERGIGVAAIFSGARVLVAERKEVGYRMWHSRQNFWNTDPWEWNGQAEKLKKWEAENLVRETDS